MTKAEMSLLDAAMLCAMRHRYGYRGYESPEKAKAALRRRCRGVERQDLEEAFSRGVAMYARAEEIVWANRHRFQATGAFDELESQLLREFPFFDPHVVREAVKWAHYWQILR